MNVLLIEMWYLVCSWVLLGVFDLQKKFGHDWGRIRQRNAKWSSIIYFWDFESGAKYVKFKFNFKLKSEVKKLDAYTRKWEDRWTFCWLKCDIWYDREFLWVCLIFKKSLGMIGVEFASEMQNEVQSSTFGTSNLERNMSNSSLILSLNLKLKN